SPTGVSFQDTPLSCKTCAKDFRLQAFSPQSIVGMEVMTNAPSRSCSGDTGRLVKVAAGWNKYQPPSEKRLAHSLASVLQVPPALPHACRPVTGLSPTGRGCGGGCRAPGSAPTGPAASRTSPP